MQSYYTNILFCCDLTVESLILARKAVALAQLFKADFNLIHIVERPVVYVHQFAEMEHVMQEHLLHAKNTLAFFGETLGVSAAKQHLFLGNPKSDLLEKADALGCDLITVGSHGAGGYQHLMGSTAQAIVATSKVDTMVFNVALISPDQKQADALYYSRKMTLGGQSGLSHGKAAGTLREQAKPSDKSTPLYGSTHGIKQATKRGPKPNLRPHGMPYGPNEREPDDSSEDQQK